MMPIDVGKSKDFALLHKVSLQFHKGNSREANNLLEQARGQGINVYLTDDGFVGTTSDRYIVAFNIVHMRFSVLDPGAADPDAANSPTWLPLLTAPPATAERLLSCLLSPDRLQEALGDFDEGYKLMLTRHGVGHAHRWYWVQVMKVTALAVFELACRVAKAWNGFGPA